jgi:uncharacterized protein YdbL (DUF1318 family)
MNHHIKAAAWAAFVVHLFVMAPCAAQDPKPKPPETPVQQPDPLAELKKKMKARYADLERLRDDGKVGETWNGEVAVVKAVHASEKVDPKSPTSPTIGAFVDTENSDRKQLYALLAKELKITAAEVAKQNGLRTIDKADSDHWLKLEDGRWIQRKDVKAKKDEKESEKKDGTAGDQRRKG